LHLRFYNMQFIRSIGVYILLVIFVVSSNGFMLIQARCSCNEKSTMSFFASNGSNESMQMKGCCHYGSGTSCCAEKKEPPRKENCKCSSFFYKIPVFFDSMQKTVFNAFTGFFYFSKTTAKIPLDHFFFHSSKPTKPPGKSSRSMICMISSFLL
jgi:hypothetical protein